MARKTLADLGTSPQAEEFKMLAEFHGELAQEVYDAQDTETRAVIDRIRDTLMAQCEGNVRGVSDTYTAHMLLHLAVEVVKDLAMLGIQVSNFTFPAKVCAACGSDA